MTVRHEDDDKLAQGVAKGERAALARAITLVESRRTDHRRRAQVLLQSLLPRTGGAFRVGITGVPAVSYTHLTLPTNREV